MEAGCEREGVVLEELAAWGNCETVSVAYSMTGKIDGGVVIWKKKYC